MRVAEQHRVDDRHQALLLVGELLAPLIAVHRPARASAAAIAVEAAPAIVRVVVEGAEVAVRPVAAVLAVVAVAILLPVPLVRVVIEGAPLRRICARKSGTLARFGNHLM